ECDVCREMKKYILNRQEEWNQERLKLRNDFRSKFLGNLQVNIGSGKEKPFTKAQNDYLQKYYREADAHLKDNDYDELVKSLQKEEMKSTDRKDVDLPPMYIAVTTVFQKAKQLCSDAPSLVVADYVISETFNRNEIFTTAMKNMPDDERNKLFKVKPEFIKSEECRGIFLSYRGKSKVFNIFLQVNTSRAEEEQIKIITSHTGNLTKKKASWILPMAGGSGTGKTIIVKEIAKRFAEGDKVLLVNLAGGELTKYFQEEFHGKTNIKVMDGVHENIPENLQGIYNFLDKNGKDKHVLFDEVPLTLGFEGPLDEKRLTKHWKDILFKSLVKSLTLAFRPNDETYTTEIDLKNVKIAGVGLKILHVVKRNTIRVSDLFLALGNYERWYPKEVIVILDLLGSKWRNYLRMMYSCQKNIVIAMEFDVSKIGKYFEIYKETLKEPEIVTEIKEMLLKKLEKGKDMERQRSMEELNEAEWDLYPLSEQNEHEANDEHIPIE
ncbi:unnamed protein product, partial [Darwinula stevensoni]